MYRTTTISLRTPCCIGIPQSSSRVVAPTQRFVKDTCVGDVYRGQTCTRRNVHQGRGMMAKVRGATSGDVQGDMLEPSLANNPWVRLASVMAVVGASAKATGTFLSLQGIGFVHMIAFGTWFGTLAWTSTVFGIVAFRTLPRQMFGTLQSKLFPKYFTVTGAAPAFMMASLYYMTQGAVPMHEMKLLGLSVLTAVANLAIAEPAATKVMFERYALENQEGQRDEEKIRTLKKQFGKWHGISSLLNLVNLVCAVGHAWFLAHCMVRALPIMV